MQFQNTSLALFGSKYDLTNFLVLFSIIPLILLSKQKTIAYIFLFAFIALHIIIWIYFQIAPIHRLISGMIWFGGLVAVSIFSDKGLYNRKIAYNLLIASMLFLSTIIVIDAVYNGVSRPKGFLDEPSYAGLLLFSCATMLLYRVLHDYTFHGKIRPINLFSLIFLLCGSALTKSMHLLTFLIMSATILFILRSRFRHILVLSILLIPGIIVLIRLLDFDHISDRLNFSGEILNISLLSWLRGLDQAKYALHNSPLLGFGLGSTGYFPFDSSHTQKLEVYGLEILNLTDAFSGLFRVTIELGGLSVLMIIYLLSKQVYGLRATIKMVASRKDDLYGHLLAIFGLSLLIGVLIKEPTYSRSYVYIGVFLIATNWFGGIHQKTTI